MKNKNGFLLFEFENKKGEEQAYAFQDPVKIYQTNKIEEIVEMFSSLEAAVEQGYYVAGCLSYEAAPAFDTNHSVHNPSAFPLAWFGVYEAPLPYQEDEVSHADFRVGNWQYDTNYHEYKLAIEEIKNKIAAGETEQINYTTRLHASFTGDDFTFYQQLARNQQASYAAYLNLGRYRVLSASPELFFRVDGEKIKTKPMKGTIKRGRYESEDISLKRQLTNSKKDRAENLMIVDLLREELAKIAVTGTVNVSKLCELETYPTVHQMTSTVEAEIEPGTTIFNLFEALFPCGSITGAPKQATMEHIRELEGSPREIYCGAIGYITPQKEAVFNVPIRTVIMDKVEDKLTYGVGGGITRESTADGEYEEMGVKAKLLTERYPVFELLESLALTNGEYLLLEEHLERLKKSARYFDFHMDEKAIRQALEKLRKETAKDSQKIRLLLNRNGKVSVTAEKLTKLKVPIRCVLASEPIDEQDVFLYHKTTHRKVYEKHQIKAENGWSILLWNRHDEITEFTTGNVVVKIAGELYTPPVQSGLLAGTFREQLLQKGEIEERIISRNDLVSAEEIYFINSVRGWLEVDLIDN